MQKIQRLLKPETEQEKQKQQILILLLIAGIGYYFFSYLPQQETRRFERIIQETISKVSQAQPQDYSALLTTCQSHLQWKDGTVEQQSALENNKENLAEAIQWLKDVEKRMTDENAEARTREEEEKKQKEMEVIRKKRFHWLRKPKSWADDWLSVDKEKYNSSILEKGIDKSTAFNSFAHYKIHFPPNLYNSLTEKQKQLVKEKGYGELKLDKETREFEFNDDIQDWYDKVYSNPNRGKPDPGTKKDNNALFYGTEGTGKTSIVRKLVHETDCYPLIEIKGSTLSPNKLDSDFGISPLEKFILTICDIEHMLEDDFGFQREVNGEVRFIMFVDEADLISREARIFEPTYLAFLKECMEQISREKQPENLWIFATNEINMIARAVYRPGRLSHPLDFSWTLGDFMKYSGQAGITGQFPAHWIESPVLNREDNKWVNRFNMPSFETYFLGRKIDGSPIPDATSFWDKFIRNFETKKILNEEMEIDEQGKETVKRKGIQWGEFFEFFWNLKDTGQLQHFDGKFVPPKPKIEEVIEKTTIKIDETLAIRLEEINNRISEIREEISLRGGEYIGTINLGVTQITGMLAEIGKKINN